MTVEREKEREDEGGTGGGRDRGVPAQTKYRENHRGDQKTVVQNASRLLLRNFLRAISFFKSFHT